MSAYARVVQDTNLAGVEALAKRIREAANRRALIGVPSGQEEKDGTSMALVGATVEFGKENQPERPFLRQGIREAVPLARQVARHDLSAVAEGTMPVEVVLERIGAVAVGVIKDYMKGDHFAPNAPSTIAKKGSDQPTIDTASLRNSITNVVEGV